MSKPLTPEPLIPSLKRIYENSDYWAVSTPSGYDVFKVGVTCSVRCAQIGWRGTYGLSLVKNEIRRRLVTDLCSEIDRLTRDNSRTLTE